MQYTQLGLLYMYDPIKRSCRSNDLDDHLFVKLIWLQKFTRLPIMAYCSVFVNVLKQQILPVL